MRISSPSFNILSRDLESKFIDSVVPPVKIISFSDEELMKSPIIFLEFSNLLVASLPREYIAL